MIKTSMSRPFGVVALIGSDRLNAGLQTRGVPLDRFLGRNARHQIRGTFPEPVHLADVESSAHYEFDSARRSGTLQSAFRCTCNTFSMRIHSSWSVAISLLFCNMLATRPTQQIISIGIIVAKTSHPCSDRVRPGKFETRLGLDRP